MKEPFEFIGLFSIIHISNINMSIQKERHITYVIYCKIQHAKYTKG